MSIYMSRGYNPFNRGDYMPRKRRELTITVETTENTSRLFTEMLLRLYEQHPELTKKQECEKEGE